MEGNPCLLYTSDAADDMQCVDLGGRRIIKKVTIAPAGALARQPHTPAEETFFQAEDGIRGVERSRGLGECIRDSFLIKDSTR